MPIASWPVGMPGLISVSNENCLMFVFVSSLSCTVCDQDFIIYNIMNSFSVMHVMTSGKSCLILFLVHSNKRNIGCCLILEGS